jgi:riboflavin synthase
MFTGIVEELGEVVAIDDLGDAARLTVRGPLVTGDVANGDSIAVSGVCLTVSSHNGDTFSADVMRETLIRSSLGALAPGAAVNLERSVRLADRLGGHLVQGHVDGTGTITSRAPAEHWDMVRIALPPALDRYVVEKGSIAVDGISLTIVSAGAGQDAGQNAGQNAGQDKDAGTNAGWFEVSLIPETLKRTTLGTKQAGDTVNLEVDMIAKYVEKLLGGTVRP